MTMASPEKRSHWTPVGPAQPRAARTPTRIPERPKKKAEERARAGELQEEEPEAEKDPDPPSHSVCLARREARKG